MPVTVKFSREFYDKFGHEAVDELVNYLNLIDFGYKTELRELNERNAARFDASLDQRATAIEARVDRRITALEAKVDQRIAALEAKVDQRIAALEAKLDQRVAQLDAKIERIAAELRAETKSHLAAMETRLIRWMFVFVTTGVLAILGLG